MSPRSFTPPLLAALALIITAAPAAAQLPSMKDLSGKGLDGLAGGGAVPGKKLLMQASDGALDKLAKPGAFQADEAIRIGLPGQSKGQSKGLGALAKLAGQSGLGGDITGSLNTAAGQAAGAAKPIFRAAIDKMSMRDAMGMVSGGTGATDYLRRSAGDQIKAQLTPLVRAALGKTGVLAKSSQLSAVGLNPDSLTSYVVGKTADGIFTYMGREETHIRQDPSALLRH